jgi:hypothetical protein
MQLGSVGLQANFCRIPRVDTFGQLSSSYPFPVAKKPRALSDLVAAWHNQFERPGGDDGRLVQAPGVMPGGRVSATPIMRDCFQ